MRARTFIWILAALPAVAQAQPTRVENQAAYLSRCRTETMAQKIARPQADSICNSNWQMISSAGSMAETMIMAAVPQGVTFDPAAARAKLTLVRWNARPQTGAVASGKIGDTDVNLMRVPRPQLGFDWSKDGEPIPFNLPEALRVRGATLTMTACLSFGASENTLVYRVTVPMKAPFGLIVASREAAVASESSDFSAVANYSGTLPTLAELRRESAEYMPSCPQ